MIQNFLKHIYTVHCLVKWTLNELNTECSLICEQNRQPFMSQDRLKILCNAFVHSVLNCWLIYWRNSSRSANIFKTQKIMFRIITGSIVRDLCKGLFTSASLFTLYTIIFVFVVNSNNFKLYSDAFNINMRQKHNIQQALSCLPLYETGTAHFLTPEALFDCISLSSWVINFSLEFFMKHIL